METTTDLIYRGLSRNMFSIAIRINTAKIPDLRNKVSFGRYQSLNKGSKILA